MLSRSEVERVRIEDLSQSLGNRRTDGSCVREGMVAVQALLVALKVPECQINPCWEVRGYIIRFEGLWKKVDIFSNKNGKLQSLEIYLQLDG